MRRWGTGRLVAASVGLTAAAILGFSACRKFWQLVLLTLPYGLGAGAIDSALNNYVAIHYGPRHMSWLHCCWGIGTSVGPVAMGWALAGPLSWHGGYLVIGVAQAAITAALVASLPLWRRTGAAVADGAKMAENSDAAGADAGNEGCVNDAAGASRANGDAADSGSGCADKTCGSSSNGDNPGTSHEGGEGQGGSAAKPLSYPELLRLPGAAAVIGSFGCYSALESSMGLWIASHLVLARGIGEAQAASMVALFYLGITFGRFVSGVVANRVAGRNMIRAGQVVIACGLVLLVTCKNDATALSAAIALVGLGCARRSTRASSRSRRRASARRRRKAWSVSRWPAHTWGRPSSRRYARSSRAPERLGRCRGSTSPCSLSWSRSPSSRTDGRRASPPEDEGRTSKRQKRRLRT